MFADTSIWTNNLCFILVLLCLNETKINTFLFTAFDKHTSDFQYYGISGDMFISEIEVVISLSQFLLTQMRISDMYIPTSNPLYKHIRIDTSNWIIDFTNSVSHYEYVMKSELMSQIQITESRPISLWCLWKFSQRRDSRGIYSNNPIWVRFLAAPTMDVVIWNVDLRKQLH